MSGACQPSRVSKFKCRLHGKLNASLLKDVVNAMMAMATVSEAATVDFMCDAKGDFQVELQDSGDTPCGCRMIAILQPAAWSDFKCERPFRITVSLDPLAIIMDMFQASDELLLVKASDENDVVKFQCYTTGSRLATSYNLPARISPLAQRGPERPPDYHLSALLLSTEEFQKSCQRLWRFGSSTRIAIKKTRHGHQATLESRASWGALLHRDVVARDSAFGV